MCSSLSPLSLIIVFTPELLWGGFGIVDIRCLACAHPASTHWVFIVVIFFFSITRAWFHMTGEQKQNPTVHRKKSGSRARRPYTGLHSGLCPSTSLPASQFWLTKQTNLSTWISILKSESTPWSTSKASKVQKSKDWSWFYPKVQGIIGSW